MRVSAVALMASSALAHNAPTYTDYSTQLVTVTACPASVIDCPARSKTSSIVTSLLPLTTSTVYATRVHTITSCAPTVTDCPAHSTVVTTETIPVSTTVCTVGPSSPLYPSHYNNSTSLVAVPTAPMCTGDDCPPESTGVPTGPSGPSGNTHVPQPGTQAPICAGTSVTAITKTYTTVLTSVELSTIQGSCPTEVQGPQGTVTPSAVIPPVATAPAGSNTTQPGGVPPPVTAGAASLTSSVLLAAAAGVAALVMA